jgi:hypothetical protein
MTYDYPTNTNFNASKGLTEYLGYINGVTDGWVSKMMLLSIWFIIVAGFYKARDDLKGAFATASFVTFVLALLFWAGGFSSGWEVTITLGLTIISALALLMDK